MDNPALRQEPRYEPAAILPRGEKISIFDWLNATGRFLPRVEQEAKKVHTDIPELMDGDEELYGDEDDIKDLDSCPDILIWFPLEYLDFDWEKIWREN